MDSNRSHPALATGGDASAGPTGALAGRGLARGRAGSITGLHPAARAAALAAAPLRARFSSRAREGRRTAAGGAQPCSVSGAAGGWWPGPPWPWGRGWARGGRRQGGGPPAPGLLARLPVVPVVAAADLPGAAARGELAKYGLPALRSRESYVLCYDPRSRGALWVLEQLRGAALSGPSERAACDFQEDESVHEYHRATNADYRGSGFDRGHLAAAANHRWSQQAMQDTFYLSNVAPQVPHLNQKAWNNLEKYCRSLTKYNQNVYVCTGPLFLPRMEADGKMYIKYQVIGKNNVAVPTHFFKVLILEKLNGEIELRSYVMPNSPVEETIPLEHFLVPIESIERASGLLFVPNILKRTNRLQAITAGRNS